MFKYYFYFILFSFCSSSLAAQSFQYEASVKGLKENSLYKIPLTPDLKKYMCKDFRDLRIFDSAGREVPFVLLSEPLLKQQDFIPYEIVSQHFYKNHLEVVIKNEAKSKISNIAFNINNSDAYKYCAIDGSEDGKQWYSVSALQQLSLAYNHNYTNSYQCIYFPLNNYLYFRLKIENLHSEALKINSAGYFKNSMIAGKLNPLHFESTKKEDPEKKTSTIHLIFSANQQVDRIDFKIKSPRLFMRHATIYANRTQTFKNRSSTTKDILFECELSSDKALFFDVPALNEKELFIEIENKDNPPLEIDSLSCKQLESYLVSDLDAKNHYILKCGNAKLNAPQYDLVNFVSTIPQLLPEADVNVFKEIPRSTVPGLEKPKSFFEKKEFLWLCLALGGLVVLFFSLSLAKEMKKKSEN